MKKSVVITFVTILSVILAGPLAAHPVHDEVATLAGGLLHPLSDWSHWLPVIAIGIWAGRRRATLSTLDATGWMFIGLFLAFNSYVHVTAATHMTWGYATGMFISTVALFGTSVLMAARLKRQYPRSLPLNKPMPNQGCR